MNKTKTVMVEKPEVKKVETKVKVETPLSKLFKQSKASSLDSKIPWTLSKQDFEELRKKPCFYCGGSLSTKDVGLDRILNDKKTGFRVDNVIPCCPTCLAIRGDKLSVQEMINTMNLVKAHRADAFSTLDSRGYHLDSRTIFLFGEIDTESATNVNIAMEIMENVNNSSPINVKIMSEGGNWFDGLAIYDRFKSSPCQINMRGTGMVASAATAIFQAGDVREITENCVFLVHDGLEAFEGEAKSFEAHAEASKKSRLLLYEIYSKASGKPTSFWQTLCLKDKILWQKDIIAFGLADRVIPNKKKGQNE